MRALQLIDEEPWRRARLHQLASSAHDALCPETQFRGTQIIPVILGDAGRDGGGRKCFAAGRF